MAKAAGQRLKMLYYRDILERCTDADHSITRVELQNKLQNRMALPAPPDRKSIREDLEVLTDYFELEELGQLNTIRNPDNPNDVRFSLTHRPFELSDLKQLIDCVQTARYLSEGQTEYLKDKLKMLCSEYEARTLVRQTIVTNRIKTDNHGVHYAVDTIEEAIDANQQISFRYFHRDRDKRKVYSRSGKPYIVSPWRLVYTDDNYYLIAFVNDWNRIMHFRVDRMDRLVKIDEERQGQAAFQEIRMENYTSYTFNMYQGDLEWVTMRFDKRLVDTVLDRFGADVVLLKRGANHFDVTVPVSVSEQFFGWVFGLGEMVDIIEPESVREKMKEHLEKVRKRYE